VLRQSLYRLGFVLALPAGLAAQSLDDPQRATLIGLRRFAIHTRVQVAEPATVQRVDENVLRRKVELAIQQEGMVAQRAGDVREGSAAQISLVYLVIPTKDQAGREIGFAASSCIQVSQTVRIPRLSDSGRLTYAVAPTWSSCSIMIGDTESYEEKILQSADDQIARFLTAWRSVNRPRPDPPSVSNPELGVFLPKSRR
jgi:hypothetical protein